LTSTVLGIVFVALLGAAPAVAAPAWLSPTDLSAPGQEANDPQIAVDGAGNAVAIWERSNGTNLIIQSATRPAGGSFSAPVDLSAPQQDASDPQIAVDGAGNAVAIWERSNGTNLIIQAATRPAGGSFSAPVDLSAPGQDAFEPQIALDGAGNAVAIWERSNGTNFITQAATRSPGGSFSAPLDLSAVGGDAFDPRIAVDGAGNAVAIWERDNGTDFIIQAAGYDGAGPQLRSLSIPRAGRVGKRLSFSVSPFDFWSGLGPSRWSFGDKGKAVTVTATHRYATAGSYRITFTATDTLGNATSTTAGIVIRGRGRAIGSHLARVKKGKALLRLHCPKAALCRGIGVLSIKQGRKARIVLGKHSLHIAAGKRRTVAIKLSAKAKRLLAAAGPKGLVVWLSGSGVKPAKVRLRK
jgi:hypothetical protein